MENDETHPIDFVSNGTTAEARERLHTIMSNDVAEAIEQIGQTLDACHTKKNRLYERLDQVFHAVEAVRTECGCIDTTIASKVLHLNQLMTQIVQQLARVQIPDPPPPPPVPEPIPPPTVEIDLTSVHKRLNELDHTVNDLTKLMLEKEETFLYVINKRRGSGDIGTSVHTPIRLGNVSEQRDEKFEDSVEKLQTLVRGIQNDDQHRLKAIREEKLRFRRDSLSKRLAHVLPPFNDEEETNYTNGHGSFHDGHSFDEEIGDETSRSSDQTTVGPCTLCIQERTEELGTKPIHVSRSIASSHYTEQSRSLATNSGTGVGAGAENGVAKRHRALGEALASNGHEIAFYNYEQRRICVEGDEEYSIKFDHGLVVDLYWWPLKEEWLILSEQGLYRWKPTENEYHDAYEFTNGEIGFRRIAVTSTSVFCLFRYSLMLLELTDSLQMKRLHALAPPETAYRKLADISVRKVIRSDGNEEDVLGLIWFGTEPGVLLEERFVSPSANNSHERLFRHVGVRKGRYARLASYDNGRAWLMSNTGEDVFWIIDHGNVVAGQWEATATYVKVPNGVPISSYLTMTSSTLSEQAVRKAEWIRLFDYSVLMR